MGLLEDEGGEWECFSQGRLPGGGSTDQGLDKRGRKIGGEGEGWQWCIGRAGGGKYWPCKGWERPEGLDQISFSGTRYNRLPFLSADCARWICCSCFMPTVTLTSELLIPTSRGVS